MRLQSLSLEEDRALATKPVEPPGPPILPPTPNPNRRQVRPVDPDKPLPHIVHDYILGWKITTPRRKQELMNLIRRAAEQSAGRRSQTQLISDEHSQQDLAANEMMGQPSCFYILKSHAGTEAGNEGPTPPGSPSSRRITSQPPRPDPGMNYNEQDPVRMAESARLRARQDEAEKKAVRRGYAGHELKWMGSHNHDRNMARMSTSLTMQVEKCRDRTTDAKIKVAVAVRASQTRAGQISRDARDPVRRGIVHVEPPERYHSGGHAIDPDIYIQHLNTKYALNPVPSAVGDDPDAGDPVLEGNQVQEEGASAAAPAAPASQGKEAQQAMEGGRESPPRRVQVPPNASASQDPDSPLTKGTG